MYVTYLIWGTSCETYVVWCGTMCAVSWNFQDAVVPQYCTSVSASAVLH
jgi:hypothetical protein